MKPTIFRTYTTPALLLAAAWLVTTHNASYWRLVLEQTAAASPGSIVSLALFTWASVTLLLALLAWGRLTRYVLAAVLCLSAATAYFMDHLGVMVDRTMIENVFQTDRVEVLELLNPGLALYVLLLGVLPSAAVWWLLPRRQPARRVIGEKAAVFALGLAVIALAVVPFYKDYASLFRNHRELRYLLTPFNTINGVYGYVSDLADTPREIRRIATDARKGEAWKSVPRPVIAVVVVGETARADSFSLFGYERPTNPELAARDLILFDRVTACGTSTAVSLPCMFSDLGREEFDRAEVRSREGLLEVLQRAGLRTVWLDNNSGCKGICRNAETWSPEALDVPGACDEGECFDAILLERLDRELEATRQNTVVVVHMNGSHGPSYYRRYPDDFAVFTPDCRSDELADCSPDEVRNSYDNSIRYTDWFLARVIDRLEAVSGDIDTALLYVSDHGESLGEHGLYLHGTPYFLAPAEQVHVPMLLWLSGTYGDDFGVDRACLEDRQSRPLSHDHLFHSVLGMLDITTRARRDDLDLFAGCTHLADRPKRAVTRPVAPPAAGSPLRAATAERHPAP